MLDHEDGDAEPADLDDQLAELRRLLRIEPRRRLVEQEELRLGRERPCELDAALQAVGQAAGRRLRELRKSDDSRIARLVRAPQPPLGWR